MSQLCVTSFWAGKLWREAIPEYKEDTSLLHVCVCVCMRKSKNKTINFSTEQMFNSFKKSFQIIWFKYKYFNKYMDSFPNMKN